MAGCAVDVAADEEEPSAIDGQATRRPDRINHRHAGIAARVLTRAVGEAIDRLWQLAFAIAYRLLLLWWFVRRPSHRGALVALWHDGQVLHHTTIFELILAQRPALRLDNREIVAAAFHAPDAVELDDVGPHVARYLARFRSG